MERLRQDLCAKLGAAWAAAWAVCARIRSRKLLQQEAQARHEPNLEFYAWDTQPGGPRLCKRILARTAVYSRRCSAYTALKTSIDPSWGSSSRAWLGIPRQLSSVGEACGSCAITKQDQHAARDSLYVVEALEVDDFM